MKNDDTSCLCAQFGMIDSSASSFTGTGTPGPARLVFFNSNTPFKFRRQSWLGLKRVIWTWNWVFRVFASEPSQSEPSAQLWPQASGWRLTGRAGPWAAWSQAGPGHWAAKFRPWLASILIVTPTVVLRQSLMVFPEAIIVALGAKFPGPSDWLESIRPGSGRSEPKY